ncbi:MAG TPA: histidinol dehydrogenase, partial [Bacillota bacterium]
MVVRRVSAKVFRRMAEARGASVASAAGRPGRGRGAGGSARGRAAAVREIIGAVRRRGDEALIEYAARFDGVGLSLDGLTLGSEAIAAGARACPPEMREALALAMANIDAFHRRQVIGSWWEQGSADGGLWRGQLVRPLDSVGLYVPGGTAAYPSTVLMGAVPARVAGVRRVVICTPPLGDGSVPASVLAAAELCGITEIHPVGGAQAVAALAYGTAAVRKVDKIIGPGNAYVAEAKRQVAGDVGIDAIAGPSEVLIIADETADPALLAADLLAQAEHDALAVPVLIATSGALLERTAAELEAQVARMSRQAIARQALAGQGALVLVKSLDEAVELAGLFAPEHLELQVADAFALLPAVRHAGSVFLGRLTAEAFGDYAAGVNHVLPTSGTARFASSLGVADFTVRSQALAVTPAGAAALDRASTVMARSEGLEGHALAVEARRAAVGVEPGGVAPAAAPAATVAPAAPEFERSLAAGAREVFAAWGYREVGAPLFLPLEDLDPALGSNGLRDRLFKFVDPSGRIMVVRPDWTLPVARGAVAALRSGSAPMRLSYAGDVYRRGSRASALSRGGSGDWEGARIPQA